MSDMHESYEGDSRKIPPKPDEKLLVSRREAAARLSISQRALDYLIANKTLTTRRIGSRVLIPEYDLRRFARGDHPERLAS
jgi:excisionase family DNA binding protein